MILIFEDIRWDWGIHTDEKLMYDIWMELEGYGCRMGLMGWKIWVNIGRGCGINGEWWQLIDIGDGKFWRINYENIYIYAILIFYVNFIYYVFFKAISIVKSYIQHLYTLMIIFNIFL